MVIEAERKLITVREAAKQCGRNMETVRRWIWSGKLSAEKLGNQLFIKERDLEAFCLSKGINQKASFDVVKFLAEAKALRERIWKRTGTTFDVSELIEESRRRRYE